MCELSESDEVCQATHQGQWVTDEFGNNVWQCLEKSKVVSE